MYLTESGLGSVSDHLLDPHMGMLSPQTNITSLRNQAVSTRSQPRHPEEISCGSCHPKIDNPDSDPNPHPDHNPTQTLEQSAPAPANASRSSPLESERTISVPSAANRPSRLLGSAVRLTCTMSSSCELDRIILRRGPPRAVSTRHDTALGPDTQAQRSCLWPCEHHQHRLLCAQFPMRADHLQS